MKIEQMTPMTPNQNGEPINTFQQDSYHMGQFLGSNVAVMYQNFETQECQYLIVVDRLTGQRIKIAFDLHEHKTPTKIG